MATAALTRDPLMPAGLDADGQVAWHVLGTIARINGDGRWTIITVAEIDAFDDADWDGLACDTPAIDGPITVAQRALIRAELADLERADRGQPDRWWDR